MATSTTNVNVAFVTYDCRTYLIEIDAPVGAEPTELYDALKAVGFAEDDRFVPLPPLGGRQERSLVGPTGSELFGAWSEHDAAKFIAPAQAALAAHGFADVSFYTGERD